MKGSKKSQVHRVPLIIRSTLWILLLIQLSGCSSDEPRIYASPKGRLVDLRKQIPSLLIDLRYATSQNVTGRALYPANMPCLAHRETAKKLAKAQASLQAQGFGLKIWDAWRPPEVQVLLHRHGETTGMFLDPEHGWSRHCAGIAIDATLVDAHGLEQRMPTYFDEDLQRASREYQGSDATIRANLQRLRGAMEQAGFATLESEWWHYDDKDYLRKPQRVAFGHEFGLDFGVNLRTPVRRIGSTLLLAEPGEP